MKISAYNNSCASDETKNSREAKVSREAKASREAKVSREALKNQYSSIAQPVEHAAVNRRVVGSSPT
jgi:hypothetical protein